MNLLRVSLALLVGPAGAVAGTVEKFSIEGKAVTLKVPDAPAPGKPWLWVGEFAGHLKSLEDGLVDAGWHVAHVNLSNQFGSPRAMAVWEKLYAEMHERRGLSAKPALLGISRGGLYVNAWTRLHPDRVSVLYLDNGVCDIRSWPGGFQLTAKGAGSAKDWALYRTEFGFASDEAARAKSVRPADGLEAAVKAGVFLISVHGTADRVVPYVDNAQRVVERWEKSGGRFKLFAKPGGDHHPHGLPDPKPLIELLCAEGNPRR
ncbi:MAG: alpha/beta hydrolase [Verrucomicrobia bacterium]|nr:alpha/beta hydrolase [Verrucomicrobiota bacterium]